MVVPAIRSSGFGATTGGVINEGGVAATPRSARVDVAETAAGLLTGSGETGRSTARVGKEGEGRPSHQTVAPMHVTRASARRRNVFGAGDGFILRIALFQASFGPGRSGATRFCFLRIRSKT